MTNQRTSELLNELTWSDLCTDYPAEALQEALEERLAERIDIQEMEMRVLLNEIFTRLAERDTLKMKYRFQFDEVESLRRRLKGNGKAQSVKITPYHKDDDVPDYRDTPSDAQDEAR
jgi:hypothetical protein